MNQFCFAHVDSKNEDLTAVFTEEDIDNALIINDKTTMAHIMSEIGLFPSVGQARKNGWDKPIPFGFSEWIVGKNQNRKEVFIWNKHPNDC